MKKLVSGCCVLLFSLPVFSMDYEPWSYTQDFENRELNAWSSYPPIQDTAFEMPYIYPGTIVPGDANTSLCKILYPQSNNPQLTGVVKRLSMRLDNSSRIRFRYYIKTTVQPSWFGIDLPLTDGSRVRARYTNPPLNRWIEADYSPNDILMAAGKEERDTLDITALAVTVRFEVADPDIPIVLGLDDIEVTGSKPSSFRIVTPEIESLDEWEDDIALRHYHHGESLDIVATSPGSSPRKVMVSVRRFDRPVETVASFHLEKEGTTWQSQHPMVLNPEKFPPCLYEAEILGTMNGKPVIRSVLAFFVVDDARFSEHPRFLFTGDTVGDFKHLLENKYPRFLAYIRNRANDVRKRYSTDLPYDLEYFPSNSWLGSYNAYQTRIITVPRGMYANALVYAIDGDREAAGWAKSTLVNLCRWTTWTHPWMLNRGHHTYLNVSNTVRGVAKTYDILYDLLSPEERRIVREALIRNGIETAYKSYVVADMVTNHESNWVVSIVGSASLAGSLIIGDMDDSSSLEPYLTGCLMKLRAHMRTVYGGDSGYIEGFGYAFGTLRMYSQFIPLFEQTLGLDFNWMFAHDYGEVFWVGDHDRHIYFSFGDTGTSGSNTFKCFPWFVERFRDPALAWLLDMNPLSPDPYTIHTVRYKTDDVPRERPELAGAKRFQRTGTAVFRSDNGPDPFIFTFRCGPFGNHQHLDQGTFYLHDRGETLLTELGPSDYYEDPCYQSHIIQPIGHNCILIDGNPHSQRTGDHASYAIGMEDHAHITAFVSGKSLAWVDGDLSPLYLGNVSSLTRGVLWITPRTVLVLDRLTAANVEATMQSLFHGHSIGSMSVNEAGFSVQSGKEKLRAVVLSPISPNLSLDPNIVKLSNFTDNPIKPSGRVTLTAETRNGAALSAVLMSTDLKLLRITQGKRGSVLAELANAHILINPTYETLPIGSLSTDGIMAVFMLGGELLVVEGTHCSVNGRMIVQADNPVTIIVEGSHISFKAPSAATIKIKKDRSIQKVKLDGKELRNWRRNSITGMISIPVPAGHGTIVLEE